MSKEENENIVTQPTIKSEHNISKDISEQKLLQKLNYSISGIRIGSLLRTWTEISNVNYISQPLDGVASGHSVGQRSIAKLAKELLSAEYFVPSDLRDKRDTEIIAEQFPINITTLMNEDQLWGCFYIFPELYADVFSPIVHIRNIEDVPEIVGGILTRDMITVCLTYLKRTPILGDFVYIKLDLSFKLLSNIELLQHYKYLVYLDLSSNLLTDLKVLSHLLYLQFLSVAFNRLNTVLEYDTPQWFLTEVNYKYNAVNTMRDLSSFWSITILDLSHNNIKSINGLDSLRHLRRLDLSFNHIQRLENLNHLRLLWLDLSYNNISSFEFGPNSGLWTLLHLEYINLNENNLTSMKVFSGCCRVKELHVRNNCLTTLFELALFLRQMRRLTIIDLRANPVCSVPGYKDLVINTFPILLNLDAEELDPVEQRSSIIDVAPDIHIFGTRRLLRLLYIEQLSKAHVPPTITPADTKEVPIVVIVGYEAIGKGTLARRLASECNSHIELALRHTTATYHIANHYKQISRSKFDDMLLAGEFLTYSEINSASYGLSREEAFIKDGKVKIVTMDLISALMLKLRGRRPYIILASFSDKWELLRRQQNRKFLINETIEKRSSLEPHYERTTLQVLISGRIIITGILNEILLDLPEEKCRSEFVLASECSLLKDSEIRQQNVVDPEMANKLLFFVSSNTSLEEVEVRVRDRHSPVEASLYSLYKDSQGTDDFNTGDLNVRLSSQDTRNNRKSNLSPNKNEKISTGSRVKSFEFNRYASSTWKGMAGAPINSKSSKSVTFTSQDTTEDVDPLGMIIEPQTEREGKMKSFKSISTKLQWPQKPIMSQSYSTEDLWLKFLEDTGILQTSETIFESASTTQRETKYDTTQRETKYDTTRRETKYVDPNYIIKQLHFYNIENVETPSTTIKDDYESIHRKCPGLFWDTITMDDPDEAFYKMKRIIRDIVNLQKDIKPMFDIDFTNLENYRTVQKKLNNIRNFITPQRLFY